MGSWSNFGRGQFHKIPEWSTSNIFQCFSKTLTINLFSEKKAVSNLRCELNCQVGILCLRVSNINLPIYLRDCIAILFHPPSWMGLPHMILQISLFDKFLVTLGAFKHSEIGGDGWKSRWEFRWVIMVVGWSQPSILKLIVLLDWYVIDVTNLTCFPYEMKDLHE